MRSARNTKEEWGAKPTRRIPTLVDLCVQKAVDNVRYLGDVGETDQHLLERILPHCNVDQLTHIEDSTEERDLSPITDKLWKNFYVQQFGAKSTSVVVDRMKQKRVSFSWRQLYEAKQKDVEEAQQKSFERIKQLYKKEDAKKQSRQVQLCTKVPPSSNKRSWFGGGINIGNNKSGIMKKAKLEFINSREVKNLSAMKRATVSNNHVHNNHRVVPVQKLSQYPKNSAASSSKFNAPPTRRF
ncbi:RNA polymerase II transcription factor SIII, subunit A [Artemisia annua]|uniref:RNA polymerase II transcription factor SIII, subunit A n=1 Tax=Artemisia annua TaxID=35608 RepID=A0A2U1PTI1_ARTAN|nr:RNA polymerase II transcription factor SIII, subunit A [Artemisia annua]